MFLRDGEARKEVSELRTGMELARSVYVNSKRLLVAGTTLTDEEITTLKKWQVHDVIVRVSEDSDRESSPT